MNWDILWLKTKLVAWAITTLALITFRTFSIIGITFAVISTSMNKFLSISVLIAWVSVIYATNKPLGDMVEHLFFPKKN